MSSNAWTTFSCSTCDVNIKYLKLTNFCHINVFVNLQGKYVHSSSPKLEPLAITILFVYTLCTLLWHKDTPFKLSFISSKQQGIGHAIGRTVITPLDAILSHILIWGNLILLPRCPRQGILWRYLRRFSTQNFFSLVFFTIITVWPFLKNKYPNCSSYQPQTEKIRHENQLRKT